MARFGSLASLNPAGRSVDSTDVFIGAVLGLAGAAGAKMLFSKVPQLATAPEIVKRAVPLLGAAAAGAAISFLGPKLKLSPDKASGYFVGAVAAGAALTAWGEVKNRFPQLADIVDLRLNGYGIPIDEPNYNGVITDDSQISGGYLGQASMDDLRESAMGGDESATDMLLS